ncbi:MAG: VTT domain-containing protein [Hyphomicrobium sp.]
MQTIVDIVREHQGWAAPVAFLVAFAESFCFVSIVWPGTAILAGITALLAAGGADMSILWPAIFAAGLGGTFGYAISYWIGRYFKDSIAGVWPFTRQPELIPRGKDFFDKYGGWSVFFGHFFGPVRAIIPVVAGMFEMRQLPFQLANAASAFLWAAGVIAPSFFMVTFKEQIFSALREHELLVAVAMFLIALANTVPMALFAVPTLLAFVGLGFAHLLAGGNLLPLLVAGAAGAFLGDALAYRSGRVRKTDFHAAWRSGWSEAAADEAREAVAGRGLAAVVTSKFHTTGRAFVPFAAGAAELPFIPFLVVSAVAAVAWAAVLLSPRLVLELLGW